jgi:signal transduction histidine kinase
LSLLVKHCKVLERIADLLPPVLDKFGLDAGIEELCSEFNSSKAVLVTYKNTIDFDEMEKI